MYLAECYEGVTPEQVRDNTGFALDVSRSVVATPPTAEELRILRDEVDPQRLILGLTAARLRRQPDSESATANRPERPGRLCTGLYRFHRPLLSARHM